MIANVGLNASPWKIHLSFSVAWWQRTSGNSCYPEKKNGLDVRNTGWTFEILAGFSNDWLDIRNIGWTFEIGKNVQSQKSRSSENFGHTPPKSYKNLIKSNKAI